MPMDLKDLAERLDKLENKIKMNFFEIEKRLVNLESSPSPEGNLEEKVSQIKDMMMIIQLENEKIRDMAGSKGLTIGEKPISFDHSITSDMDELKKQVMEIKGRLAKLEATPQPKHESILNKGKGVLEEINNILHKD